VSSPTTGVSPYLLKIGSIIGEGEFGSVYRGIYQQDENKKPVGVDVVWI